LLSGGAAQHDRKLCLAFAPLSLLFIFFITSGTVVVSFLVAGGSGTYGAAHCIERSCAHLGG